MRRPDRLVDAVLSLVRSAARTGRRPGPRPAPPSRSGPAGVDTDYRPRADGRPDPGEVVWAWVPYDEGDGRGKDRPVLVVGRRGADLVGLILSSRDHDRDAAD